jgi:hypothetical protein
VDLVFERRTKARRSAYAIRLVEEVISVAQCPLYVNTSKQVGDAEHIKVFATTDAAETWFACV